MDSIMTRRTERNQIWLGVVALAAAKLNVMDLQITPGPALLAPPAIADKNFPMQFEICCVLQSQTRSFWIWWRQVEPLGLFRSSCCIDSGSKAKSRSSESSRVSGFSPSTFAPARKSAQIISSM